MIGESEFILIQVEKQAAVVTSLLNRVTLQAYPSLVALPMVTMQAYLLQARACVCTFYSAHPCLKFPRACLTKLKSLKPARLNYLYYGSSGGTVLLETGIYWVLLLFCRMEDFLSQQKISEEHLEIRFGYMTSYS